MKVGHIVSSLLMGGIQRFVLSLARQQVVDGHGVVVFVLNGDPEPSFAAELTEAGVDIVCLYKRSNQDPRAMLRLGRAMRASRIDVLHTHGYPLVYALPPALLQGVPVVHTLHALMEVEIARGTVGFYRAAIASRVPFVAISDAVAASFRRRFGASAEVIDSGVDLERFSLPVDRAAVRAEYGIPADARVVTTVARAELVKGVDLALEVFCRVADASPDVHWVMAGDGAALPALRQAVPAALSGRVHLLGLVTDVPPLLRASDAFLLASRSEGLGLSVIEALAAGLPCVVFPVGGLPELVDDGHNGLVAAEASVAAAAVALDRLLSDRSLARRCAENAAPSVARFALARAASAYSRTYETARRSRSRRWVRLARTLTRLDDPSGH